MTAISLFFCTALLLYWTSRVIVLMRGPADRAHEVLSGDLNWVRGIIGTLRGLFIPVVTT